MAAMTVAFMKVVLKMVANKVEEDYSKIRQLVESALEAHSVDNGEYRSLDLYPNLAPTDIDPKKILDVFADDKYLFGRICKKKSNSAILKRHYGNLKADDVLTSREMRDRGIEVFTFFILDYNQGLLSIVNTKEAPGANALNGLFENYIQDYYLEFVNIPNEDGIKLLYNAKQPQISGIEFEIPVPSTEALQRILGLDETAILDMIQENVMMVSLSLKPMPYHKLTSKREDVRQVLDILIGKKKRYHKTIVKGNSETFNSRKFDLHAKYFTYPIDVQKYRIKDGRKVEYSQQEIIEQFRDGLVKAYEKNQDLISAIANREESDE